MNNVPNRVPLAVRQGIPIILSFLPAFHSGKRSSPMNRELDALIDTMSQAKESIIHPQVPSEMPTLMPKIILKRQNLLSDGR